MSTLVQKKEDEIFAYFNFKLTQTQNELQTQCEVVNQ